MNETNNGMAPPGLKLGDVLHVIFRHKWKILIISGLGVITACVLPFTMPRQYQSEAKLLVKYVLETKSPREIVGNEGPARSLDPQGESILNTELQLLSSLDLAREVAKIITPEKVLPVGGGTNLETAAAVIRANLTTDVPKGSSVIRLVFQHPDPKEVQPILKQIIESYLTMHYEIHLQGGGLDDILGRETDDLHNSLQRTEDDLRRAKEAAGIISLEDSKRGYSEQISKIRASILEAEAQLEERKTAAAELAKLLHTKPVSPTNGVAEAGRPPVPAQKEAEYQRLCRQLETLRKNEDELLIHYTPESRWVQDVQAQIATNENLKAEMEAKNPGLLAVRAWEHTSGGADSVAPPRPEIMLANEVANVSALQAKIRVLIAQFDSLRTQTTNLDLAEKDIAELEREKALKESRYKYLSDSKERNRVDRELGPGSVSNIRPIQDASPPFLAATKLLKSMALILVGTIGGAFGLAFLLEYYLDPSVKRPGEVEGKLGVPLFLSIPMMNRNGKARGLKASRSTPLLSEKNEPPLPGNPQTPGGAHGPNGAEKPVAVVAAPGFDSGIAPWDPRHDMRPFSDALRDRLINLFEAKNMTHKPKLVAVTSCREGSGVSTIAAGLAASLSETGDGNVLLVDMNEQEGTAHQFHRGDLASLDDALEANTRDNALVQDNLYVVAESSTGDNLPRALPKRFKNIVPRLKASDFDYIIFDLPPVSQISMTPRLSRFMDTVLVVIESEKTDKEVLKRSLTLLHESQKNICTVLNKRRSYVPKWLQQEF